MPSRKVHRAIDRIFLGEEFDAVHAFKDRPARSLGPRHRKFFHDPMTNLFIGLALGEKAYLSAVLHDIVDFSSTEAKKKWKKKGRRRSKRRPRRR